MIKLRYDRKVNFYETDAQGIVHHSNYPRYFEEARGFFLEYVGYPYPKLREEINIDVVLLKLEIEYHQPLYFQDKFYILFNIEEFNRFKFSFFYQIFKEDILVATGKTSHCCIDRKTRKIVSIPPFLLEKFKGVIND